MAKSQAQKQNQYSRGNPSAEYHRLAALYNTHHASEKKNGWGKNTTYPGRSLWPHIGIIKALITHTGSKSLLDYGAGKGRQYEDLRVKEAGQSKIYPSVSGYWEVDVTCYDPGNPAFNVWPSARFDCVISTDVLEHCPVDDMHWIISEMFEKADKFVFANIACYPARTILSTGENAHITIEQPEWWASLIEDIAKNYPDVSYCFIATTDRSQPGTKITNVSDLQDIPKAGALPGNIIKAYTSLIQQKLRAKLG